MQGFRIFNHGVWIQYFVGVQDFETLQNIEPLQYYVVLGFVYLWADAAFAR